jgi:regulator of protease activity HflC (stomatin/prohibitin superfamily)
MCPVEYLSGRVSLRVQQLNVSLETKTKDNVFVTVQVSVQYQAIKDRVYSAYYVLTDPHSQMKAYVYDSIRASLCHMTLDQSFEAKEDISHSLKTHLQEIMNHYGFSILQALVTDLSPDARVRDGKLFRFMPDFCGLSFCLLFVCSFCLYYLLLTQQP